MVWTAVLVSTRFSVFATVAVRPGGVMVVVGVTEIVCVWPNVYRRVLELVGTLCCNTEVYLVQHCRRVEVREEIESRPASSGPKATAETKQTNRRIDRKWIIVLTSRYTGVMVGLHQ